MGTRRDFLRNIGIGAAVAVPVAAGAGQVGPGVPSGRAAPVLPLLQFRNLPANVRITMRDAEGRDIPFFAPADIQDGAIDFYLKGVDGGIDGEIDVIVAARCKSLTGARFNEVIVDKTLKVGAGTKHLIDAKLA